MTDEEIDRSVTRCCDVASRLRREGDTESAMAVFAAACALRSPRPVTQRQTHFVSTPGVRVEFSVECANPSDVARCIETAITDAFARGLRPRS